MNEQNHDAQREGLTETLDYDGEGFSITPSAKANIVAAPTAAHRELLLTLERGEGTAQLQGLTLDYLEPDVRADHAHTVAARPDADTHGYVFMRGQQMYHTNQHTYEALSAVKRWDAHTGQDLTTHVFEHGRATGLIREGAPTHAQEEHHQANPDPSAAAASAQQDYAAPPQTVENGQEHEVGFGY